MEALRTQLAMLERQRRELAVRRALGRAVVRWSVSSMRAAYSAWHGAWRPGLDHATHT